MSKDPKFYKSLSKYGGGVKKGVGEHWDEADKFMRRTHETAKARNFLKQGLEKGRALFEKTGKGFGSRVQAVEKYAGRSITEVGKVAGKVGVREKLVQAAGKSLGSKVAGGVVGGVGGIAAGYALEKGVPPLARRIKKNAPGMYKEAKEAVKRKIKPEIEKIKKGAAIVKARGDK